MNTTSTSLITIPIITSSIRCAEQFAAEQVTFEKGKQVFFNTLAVYAVHNYLNYLGIETDINEGDSWNAILRSLLDTADLLIPNIGKLECRPILPGDITCCIPPEVAEDRIGYIGVQFGEKLDKVQLLGFSPIVFSVEQPENLIFRYFEPLDSLLDYLARLQSANVFLQSSDPVATKFREKLGTQKIQEVTARLDRIYQATISAPEKRPFIVGDVLIKNISFMNNEVDVDNPKIEVEEAFYLQDISMKILNKLEENWKKTTSCKIVDEIVILKALEQQPLTVEYLSYSLRLAQDDVVKVLQELWEKGYIDTVASGILRKLFPILRTGQKEAFPNLESRFVLTSKGHFRLHPIVSFTDPED